MITLATVGIITAATLIAQQSFGISMPTLQRGTGSGDEGGPKAQSPYLGIIYTLHGGLTRLEMRRLCLELRVTEVQHLGIKSI